MGYIETIMDISSLLYVDAIADLAQFKVRAWSSFILTQTGYVCTGLGFDNEKIDLQLTLQDGFIDCMKTIISNICDPSSAWTGIDAKYFTKCSPSAR